MPQQLSDFSQENAYVSLKVLSSIFFSKNQLILEKSRLARQYSRNVKEVGYWYVFSHVIKKFVRRILLNITQFSSNTSFGGCVKERSFYVKSGLGVCVRRIECIFYVILIRLGSRLISYTVSSVSRQYVSQTTLWGLYGFFMFYKLTSRLLSQIDSDKRREMQ